jgi:hypothetical protein
MFFQNKKTIFLIIVTIVSLICLIGAWIFIRDSHEDNINKQELTGLEATNQDWNSNLGNLLNQKDEGDIPIYIDEEISSSPEGERYVENTKKNNFAIPSSIKKRQMNNALLVNISNGSDLGDMFYKKEIVSRANIIYYWMDSDYYYLVLQIEYNNGLGDAYHLYKFEDNLDGNLEYVDYRHMFGGV